MSKHPFVRRSTTTDSYDCRACILIQTGTHRANVQRQDEDDEEAQVPGQQGAKQHHALLLPEVSVAVQQKEGQEEDHHDGDAQSGAAHPASHHLATPSLLERNTHW